jgi:hypothetical protein
MSAEEFLDTWGPFAANNRMVMVFPQAKDCWADMDMTGSGDLTYLTPEGPQMKFMESIVRQVQRPLMGRKEFNYQQENMKPKSTYDYSRDFASLISPGYEGKPVEVDCYRTEGD